MRIILYQCIIVKRDVSLKFILFFFFSSRRRHTRYWRDWSSDVCSSDLGPVQAELVAVGLQVVGLVRIGAARAGAAVALVRVVAGEQHEVVERLVRGVRVGVGRAVVVGRGVVFGGRRSIKKKKMRRDG